MNILWRFVLAMVVAVIAILIGVILGDYGPWYMSWLLGTGFMILVAALGAVLFEAQEDGESADPFASSNKAKSGSVRTELDY